MKPNYFTLQSNFNMLCSKKIHKFIKSNEIFFPDIQFKPLNYFIVVIDLPFYIMNNCEVEALKAIQNLTVSNFSYCLNLCRPQT